VEYFLGAIAAVLLGTGFVLQQDAAQRAPGSDFLRLRLFADLLRQPRWLAGIAVMVTGQLLSAWVIGHMVLALSEPLLATNLLVALALAGRISGQRVRPREILGAFILLAGVSALSVARSVSSVQDSVGSPAYWPYAGAAIAAAAACFAELGRRRRGEVRAVLTGAAAGLVFGIQDALTRVTVDSMGTLHEIATLLTSWPAYCLIFVAVTGLWLMQSAFSAAPLHASLPGVTAAEPVSGIILGIVAFRERVPASAPLIALQAAGLVALVIGVVMVARATAFSSLSGRARGRPLAGRKGQIFLNGSSGAAAQHGSPRGGPPGTGGAPAAPGGLLSPGGPGASPETTPAGSDD
jgi:drug/metabolite transporter (DMT)-like permease